MFQPTDVFCLDCSIFLKNYSPTFEMIKCLHNKSGSEDLPMLGLACSSKNSQLELKQSSSVEGAPGSPIHCRPHLSLSPPHTEAEGLLLWVSALQGCFSRDELESSGPTPQVT